MRVAESTAVVTGGASGLGRATAERLVAGGGRVTLVDRPASAGAEVARQLGTNALFAAADVTSADEVAAAVDQARERFGGIHVLVNCAGIGLAQRTVGKQGPARLDDFTRVIQVNLIGTFNCIRLAGAAMAANAPTDDGERGVIINTASVAAFDGQIGQAAYAASKGGIVGLTLPVARDLAELGIRVVTIAPGTFLTPAYGTSGDKLEAYWGPQVPHPKRMGHSPEYAALVQSIVENDYLNGEVIRLDGALRFPPK